MLVIFILILVCSISSLILNIYRHIELSRNISKNSNSNSNINYKEKKCHI
jgi:hypothetical protein